MADSEVKIEFTGDSTGAEAAADRTSKAVEKTGESAKKAGTSLLDMGKGVMAAGAAFAAGYEMGVRFMDAIKNTFGVDMRNMAAGVVNLTDGVLNLGESFNDLPAKVNPAIKAIQAHGRNLAEADENLKKVLAGWKTAGERAADAKALGDAVGNLTTMIKESEGAGRNWTTRVVEEKAALAALGVQLQDTAGGLEALGAKERTAVLLATAMVDAEQKKIAARKAMKAATEGVVPEIDAIVKAMNAEIKAAEKESSTVVEMEARKKAAREAASKAMEEYGRQNGLTDKEIAKLLKSQEAVNTAMLAGAPAADRWSKSLEDVGKAAADPALDQLPEVVRRAIEAQDALNKSLQKTAFEMENIKNAANESSKVFSGWTRQMTDFGDVMGTSTKGFEGNVTVLTLGMESLSQASQEATDKMMKMFTSLEELNKSNSGMAERTAAVINNLRDSWANGMTDLTAWLQVWENYYQSMNKIMLLNPGSAIAADMAKAIEAFKQLRQEVLMGKVPMTPRTNWGF